MEASEVRERFVRLFQYSECISRAKKGRGPSPASAYLSVANQVLDMYQIVLSREEEQLCDVLAYELTKNYVPIKEFHDLQKKLKSCKEELEDCEEQLRAKIGPSSRRYQPR